MKRERKIDDPYVRACLMGILVLLALAVAWLWATGPALVSPAVAAPPEKGADGEEGRWNSGAQRIAIVSAIEATNSKLDRLLTLLENGKLQVVVVEQKEAGDGRKGK